MEFDVLLHIEADYIKTHGMHDFYIPKDKYEEFVTSLVKSLPIFIDDYALERNERILRGD